ncbi:unnamed protein product [Lepeophtheirus salmonis]|uniref:(salmon louse) hypothetical protein n=1 Tax=Lepeophtheirus salmonis TaxID=72036 RepID=A0A7R8CTE0_LEPSM|nr:unnamed protein product [Lepeophtheirus salmonis]CAF2926007.1 unnamed protein product [Lepeophtheirus salmonis]
MVKLLPILKLAEHRDGCVSMELVESMEKVEEKKRVIHVSSYILTCMPNLYLLTGYGFCMKNLIHWEESTEKSHLLGPGFMGIEQNVYKDSPKLNYDNFGKSIIITGCKPWTLYETENFGGSSICVYPNSMSSPCKPGFFVEPSDFGHFADQVSSVRLGCFSKSSFVAKPFIEGESKSINLIEN